MRKLMVWLGYTFIATALWGAVQGILNFIFKRIEETNNKLYKMLWVVLVVILIIVYYLLQRKSQIKYLNVYKDVFPNWFVRYTKWFYRVK